MSEEKEAPTRRMEEGVILPEDRDEPPTAREEPGAPAPPGLPPRMVLRAQGKYRLVGTVGEGTMGAVYLAEVVAQPPDAPEPLPERVAIKLMSGGEETTPRLEVGVLRSVRHPNVVRLYDWRFDTELAFAVLDYHEHGSLFDQIRREGPLSLQSVWRLLRDLLAALVETHGLGILHLDIKPGNVLIGGDGRYLLTDFGIAHAQFQVGDRRITGTPAFMSPEQARGENESLDARSDLYSLGATLWQAITGDFSVQQREAISMVQERRLKTLPRLTPSVPEAYRPLAEIVDELLEFSPRDRPGTAAEVLHRVERLVPRGLAQPAEPARQARRGRSLSTEMRASVRDQIADPVLRHLLDRQAEFCEAVLFEDGETVCDEEERSYNVFVLLLGKVEVWRHGQLLNVESREGEMLGEVSALVGKPRTATLKAKGPTVLAKLKGAEMEQAARRMPALAVRIMKGLAARLAERDSRTARYPGT